METETLLIEGAKDYLSGYQLCVDMLQLRRYERKRAKEFDEECRCEDILKGNEAFWRARMRETELLIGSLRNGREKMILYYRYIRGQSVQHSADYLGISRRTGYRIYRRGLMTVGRILQRTGRLPSVNE